MIDKDEYPQTAEIERRCVNILARLWHAEGTGATGCSTTGSSEACMLGGLALKWRWRQRRAPAGLPADRPNLVMGSERPGLLGEVLPLLRRRGPPASPWGRRRPTSRAREAVAACDENTIGVVAILGSTYDGAYEPVAEIAAALDALAAAAVPDVPMHVDGASGGFVAPFLDTGARMGLPGAARRSRSTPRATSTASSIPASAGSCGVTPRPCPTSWSSRSTTSAARCRRSP